MKFQKEISMLAILMAVLIGIATRAIRKMELAATGWIERITPLDCRCAAEVYALA
jgi:hypothetical protein